jgi:hypothetical protein
MWYVIEDSISIPPGLKEETPSSSKISQIAFKDTVAVIRES